MVAGSFCSEITLLTGWCWKKVKTWRSTMWMTRKKSPWKLRWQSPHTGKICNSQVYIFSPFVSKRGCFTINVSLLSFGKRNRFLFHYCFVHIDFCYLNELLFGQSFYKLPRSNDKYTCEQGLCHFNFPQHARKFSNKMASSKISSTIV